jgi:hypothetical protein
LVGGGLQCHRRADADSQRNLQRDHSADTDYRQPAADQQTGTATRLTLVGFDELRSIYQDGQGIGVFVRHRAVGEEILVAELGAVGRHGTAQNIEVVGNGIRVHHTGAGVLRVGQRRGG